MQLPAFLYLLPENVLRFRRNRLAVILLVDEEAALAGAIGEFLRECSFIALMRSAQDPAGIDVLVIDVVMPGIRGMKLPPGGVFLQKPSAFLPCWKACANCKPAKDTRPASLTFALSR